MFRDQIALLLDYWIRPWAAPSNTLDHGRLAIALFLAVVTAVLLQAPSLRTQQERMQFSAEMHQAQKRGQPMTPQQQEKAARMAERMMDEYAPSATKQAARWIGAAPDSALRSLFVLALAFVPASILILVRWEGLGNTRIVLARDYAALLTCLFFAWTAAHLPSAIASFWWRTPWLDLASFLYFLVLAVLCLRTALGVRVFPAAGTALASAVVAAAGGVVAGMVGGGFLWIASPCLLYYLWSNFNGSAAIIGGGLRHRQSFRRHLEALTINPLDADAHYQLGLLYLERRDFAQAESRFRQAVEIDPRDADYLFYLGRVLREQGKASESLDWLERAARENDKAANHEVWRELGAAQLALGKLDEALSALGKYVGRREYDPEGLVLYGQTLRGLGRSVEARAAFQSAVDAARTMPDYRKGQLRRWANLAKQELGKL